ncbi:MAG: hypothetical protein IKH57_12100 [Clostridia bacterium]|nr:hypothetical protein [Clostridia bacterium]
MRPPRVRPAPPKPDASVPGEKHKPGSREEENPFFDPDQVASATECTGILAAQVQTDEEAENTSSLQGIHRIKAPH